MGTGSTISLASGTPGPKRRAHCPCPCPPYHGAPLPIFLAGVRVHLGHRSVSLSWRANKVAANTAYPQQNGIVERANGKIKNLIKKNMDVSGALPLPASPPLRFS